VRINISSLYLNEDNIEEVSALQYLVGRVACILPNGDEVHHSPPFPFSDSAERYELPTTRDSGTPRTEI
jgi:hypothetical protein